MGAPQAMIRAAILTFMTFALPAWAETVDGNRIIVLDGRAAVGWLWCHSNSAIRSNQRYAKNRRSHACCNSAHSRRFFDMLFKRERSVAQVLQFESLRV